jgi:hypothetical protein
VPARLCPQPLLVLKSIEKPLRSHPPVTSYGHPCRHMAMTFHGDDLWRARCWHSLRARTHNQRPHPASTPCRHDGLGASSGTSWAHHPCTYFWRSVRHLLRIHSERIFGCLLDTSSAGIAEAAPMRIDPNGREKKKGRRFSWKNCLRTYPRESRA